MPLRCIEWLFKLKSTKIKFNILFHDFIYPFSLVVPKLRKRRRIEDAESATPLAIGYWGKPPTLEGAKFDFLCIHATLRSLKPDGPTFKEGE